MNLVSKKTTIPEWHGSIDWEGLIMYKYQIVLYWSSEDNCFIAEVPELAGCMADGETQEEALKNAETVITEWIETAKLLGREIPRPLGKMINA